MSEIFEEFVELKKIANDMPGAEKIKDPLRSLKNALRKKGISIIYFGKVAVITRQGLCKFLEEMKCSTSGKDQATNTIPSAAQSKWEKKQERSKSTRQERLRQRMQENTPPRLKKKSAKVYYIPAEEKIA